MKPAPTKKLQSDTTRHFGLGIAKGGKKEQVNNNNIGVTFSFCKSLLRNVSLYAHRRLITLDEWNQIHTQVLLDAAHKYTLDQQKELRDYVAKVQEDIKDSASSASTPSEKGDDNRGNILNFFVAAHKQQVINESQLDFFRKLITNPANSDTKENEPDAAIDEMKAVSAMYGDDFKYETAEFEERANEFSHKCTVTSRAASRGNDVDHPWVQVLFQFGVTYPNTAPRITFVDSYKCTVAELAVLESLVNREAILFAMQNKVAVVHIVSYVAKYLDTVAGMKVTKDAKTSELPYIPRGLPLTEVCQQNKNMEFINLGFEELDKTLCIALQDAVAKHNKRAKTPFEVSHIENVISPATFKQFRAKIIEYNTNHPNLPYAPLVTYHGTCSPAREASISKHGLISAGNFTPDGFFVNCAHGAVFGYGIYSTTDIGVACNYAYGDHVGNKQIFVSLTLLGTPYFIKHFDDIFDAGIYNSYYPVKGHDSHVWRKGVEQYVVYGAEQILPVLLVTLTHPGTKTLEQRMQVKLDLSGSPAIKKFNEMAKWKQLEQAREDALKNRKPTQDDLIMYRVPGSKVHWALSLTKDDVARMDSNFSWLSSSDAFAKNRSPEVRLTFILDKSESMGSTFSKVALPACAQLYQKVRPTACHLVLFGRTVDHHPPNKIGSAKFFELPEIQNTKLENATDIIGGFKKAVDIAMRDQEDIRREAEDEFFEEKKGILDEKKIEEAEKRMTKKEHKDNLDVDLNLTLKEENGLKREFERHHEKPNILNIFVMMSDGEDTINNQDTIEKTLLDTYNMFKGSRLQCIFKVIGIGKGSDTHLAMRMKLAAQTVKLWESTPVHYVRKASNLPIVMKDLADELQNILCDNSNSLKIETLQHVFGEGFIVNLTNPPVPEISARLHPTKRTSILFKGVPPRSVLMDSSGFFGRERQIYLQEKPPLDEVGSQASILELLSSLVSDIKVAIVAGREVTNVVQEVREMVEGVKTANFDEHSLAGSTPTQRVQTMKNKRRLVIELEEILNTLEDTINLGKSKMSSDQQAVWLNQVANMKYGAQALRRAVKFHVDCAAVITSLKNIKRKVQAEELLELPTDPCSAISGLSAVEHLKEINDPFPNTITDLLYSFGITGIGIQVVRSEASNIEPWRISVTYVSKDWWDTTSAMCGLHAMSTHKDSMGQQVQDVLVILDPKNPAPYNTFLKSPLHAAYMGVIFARNPDIQLPAQRSGLLMSALVRAVTQLLSPAYRTREFVAVVLKIVYTIRARISKGEGAEYWEQMLKKLTLSQPGKWMTEAPEDDIASVSKLLGVLCCSIEKVKELQLFSDTLSSKQQLAEVSLALLAETSSRGARVKIKGIINKERLKDLTAKPPNEAKVTHELVFDVLGLGEHCQHPNPSLDVVDDPITKHSDAWNMERAKKKSGVFFYNQVNNGQNNCPPQAVLACLTFAEAVASAQFESFERILEQGSVETINGLYDSVIKAFEGVSMSTFIKRYITYEGSSNMKGSTSYDLQVGLYVQGAKYHNSQTRRQGLPSLLSAKEVVDGIARDERGLQYEIELAEKLAKVRKVNAESARQAKIAKQKYAQAVFMEIHSGLPKVFGHAEVAKLNQSRPPEDQLELTGGGLLRHHCCFPNCPKYLQNLATEKDKVLGRRNGLRKHFKYMVYPDTYWVPSFHEAASSCLKRYPQHDFEQFKHHMLSGHKWEKTDFSRPRIEELIAEVYNQFTQLYQKD